MHWGLAFTDRDLMLVSCLDKLTSTKSGNSKRSYSGDSKEALCPDIEIDTQRHRGGAVLRRKM